MHKSFLEDFLSYYGPWRGHLCHIDTVLVYWMSLSYQIDQKISYKSEKIIIIMSRLTCTCNPIMGYFVDRRYDINSAALKWR